MKLKIALLALLVGFSSLLADMVVAPSALPANAQNFISTHFKGASIGLVKRDMDSFDVTLTDGTEIDFNINGEWTDVDGKYKAVPTSFLPKGVAAKVQALYPNVALIEIDREISGFKFKFMNGMKVYTDANGNVLGQKFD